MAALHEVAKAHGLELEDRLDRIVPDLGFARDGTITLDYGSRVFRGSFDERLHPCITTADGTALEGLPEPGPDDDLVQAFETIERWAEIKDVMASLTSVLTYRLELDLTRRRRLTAGNFEAYFKDHPHLGRLVRRLVWTLDNPARSFRMSQDGSLRDVTGTSLVLDSAAEICVAHPLELGEALAQWTDIFAAEEIEQPFLQLKREVYRLTDTELEACEVARFAGKKVRTGLLETIPQRGFVWDDQEAWVSDLIWPMPGTSHRLRLVISSGFSRRGVSAAAYQTIRRVVSEVRQPEGHFAEAKLGELDPASVSEAIRVLEAMVVSTAAD
jgi:hypothetical protein